MPRDVEVSIRFLEPNEGGRKSAVCNGYRGQYHYAGQNEAWDAPHEYPDSEWVKPGQIARAYLAFLSPERHVEKIQVGTSFEVREGSRLVGVGKVTKIIDLLESAARSHSRGTYQRAQQRTRQSGAGRGHRPRRLAPTLYRTERSVSSSVKSKIPFLFLVCISLWWGFYYQSNSKLNDYGSANFEWLFLLDALIVLPIICFWCVKDKKEAISKSTILMCLAVFVGSYIVPEQSKLLWHYLENGRYFVLAVILLFELVAILTVYLAIKAAIGKSEDLDLCIEKPIKQYLGEGPVAKLLSFETRMWTYALFSNRVKSECFSGEQHFTYHKKDGAKIDLLGFALLIAFEIPIMHLFLHFIWSPFAANIVTLLTVFSLIFFIAEYLAVARRPISLAGNNLIIRYGLYQPMVIPLGNIARIHENIEFVKRSRSVKRYNYSGFPNVEIELIEPVGNVKSVFIGVDSAEQFISAVLAEASRYNNALQRKSR